VGAGTALSGLPSTTGKAFECGDHTVHGSVEGALLSAEKTSQRIIEAFASN
jgi:hypothetical protein